MKYLPLIGFVSLGFVATLAVDYQGQMMSARAATGQDDLAFGVSDYLDTIKSRYGDYKTSLIRHDLADYVPAPDGWVMREYTEEDKARLNPPPKPLSPESEAHREMAEAMSKSPTAMLIAASYNSGTKEVVKAYTQGDALVGIRVVMMPARHTKGMTGHALAMAAQVHSGLEAMDPLFATVQGVEFREKIRPESPSRLLYAKIGKQVRIAIKAQASGEQIFEVLQGFNFDGVNAMLAEPLPGMGANAQTVLVSSNDPDPARTIEQDEEMVEAVQSSGGSIAERLQAAIAFAQGESKSDAQPVPSEPEIQAEPTSKIQCEIISGAKRCRIVKQ